MPKEAFPIKIYVRRESHVAEYTLNQNETVSGGKYYHIAERPESQHVHFENTLYFEGNVSVTTEVFRDEIKAKEAAHYYAKRKVQSIEKELDILYKA
jgi:hypothetical protein